jgi:hypothetical protein
MESTYQSMTKKQRYELLRAQLDSERQSFVAHWRELADYILPRRGRFSLTDRNRGDRRSNKIIDSTATLASRTLASGMMSGVTSPARPWFRLTTPDPDLAEFGPVKDWLHIVAQRMNAVFIRSNLYNALPIIYADMGTFGTAAMLVAEDDDAVIRCFPYAIGSYWIGNDSKNQVRTFMREYSLSVDNLIEEFSDPAKPDWSLFSDAVKNAWEQGQRKQMIDIIHVITTNHDYNGQRLEAKYKKYAECYYERGNSQRGGTSARDDDKYLRESGYDEWPIFAPRWEITGEDDYATNCPGMTALGDIKALQLMKKREAQGLDKVVNPPMVASPEMKASALTLLPGGVSYVVDPEAKRFRPAHEVRIDFGALRETMMETRALIRRAFFEDLFLMLQQTDRRQITATEIMERREEKLLALGPVLEQLNQDLLDPLIDRTFNIMVRKGLIPEAPEELQAMPLRVEYISVMAQAQKSVNIASLERFAMFGTELVKVTGDPSRLDKIDFDQLIDEVGEALGVPPRVIVPDEDVAAMRESRAQSEAQAQEAALLEQASKAAKNLSASPTDGRNALTDLMGGAAGQPGAMVA